MFHYIYKTSHVETREFYIGLRTSNKAPEKDKYLGSGKWVMFSGLDQTKLTKEVLATFKTREEAREAELREIDKHLNNPLMMNRIGRSMQFALKNAFKTC